jgi:3',5'-cyclic-AMP phosphodiesterase
MLILILNGFRFTAGIRAKGESTMNNVLISRRAAVLSLGGGLVGALCRPDCLLAADRELPRFSFLVVSDTHLGRNNQEGPARQWERTAREIDAAEGDLVLHLGDIVDGGREAQYPVYKETRKLIRKPVHEIPGNHDPEELFRKHIRKQPELSFDHKGVRFLLLNNSRTTSHDGFLSVRQLTWLDEQCSGAAKKDHLIILGMHVPAHSNRHPDRGWYVKPKDGQTELYALLKKHQGRFLALLHGHFHNGVRGWDDHAPVQEMVLPSALYNQDRQLARQKAPGYNLPEFRPGFVQVTLQPGAMKILYRPVGVKDTAEKVCPLPQLKS